MIPEHNGCQFPVILPYIVGGLIGFALGGLFI